MIIMMLLHHFVSTSKSKNHGTGICARIISMSAISLINVMIVISMTIVMIIMMNSPYPNRVLA